MNNKKILAILGSPHPNGITASMLNHAINEAEKSGYTVEKINLYKKRNSFLQRLQNLP